MFLASWHGVALGLARRAIDAALAVAEKSPHIPAAAHPAAQSSSRSCRAREGGDGAGAARAFTYGTIDRIWEDAQLHGHVSVESRRAMASLSLVPKRAPDCAVDMRPRRTDGGCATRRPRSAARRITMSRHAALADSFLEIVGGTILVSLRRSAGSELCCERRHLVDSGPPHTKTRAVRRSAAMLDTYEPG
jgi:hypothetical protein